MWSAKLGYMRERDNGEPVFIQATLPHRSSCLFVPKNILREKQDNAPEEWKGSKKHGNITKDKIHK